MKLSDVIFDKDPYHLSLSKITGKKIKDIEVGVSTEFIDPVLQILGIYFEDGTKLWCGGEHDLPYLEDIDENVLPDDETLLNLDEQSQKAAGDYEPPPFVLKTPK